MDTINLVVWIAVYSICLVHITLFAGIYIKNKNKLELLYLVVLVNIFLLAVIITLSLVFRYDKFIPILINGILSLYITVPVWGYFLFDVDRKFFKIIPMLVIPEAIFENILLVHDKLTFLFISRIIFYLLLTAPIFLRKKTKPEKNSQVLKMQTVTKITVTLFVMFMASLIPFSKQIFEISFVSSIFWSVFTLSYQVPGLVYCIGRLTRKDASFGTTGLSSLTKRENEVALAVCSGLKYEEIAEKLFITLSAVKKHTYSIYRKLEIKNNRELIHIFMESQKDSASNG